MWPSSLWRSPLEVCTLCCVGYRSLAFNTVNTCGFVTSKDSRRNEMSPKLGSCAGWVGWGSGDLVPKNQQTPTHSPLHLNGLWRACFVLSTYSPQSNMFLFVKVAKKKKKKSHLWFVGKLRDSLKSCYVAFPLLMSVCSIHGPRMISSLSIGFVFLGSQTVVQLWLLLLGNRVGFCRFGLGPTYL